jgi:hypothetical protein
MCIAYLCLYEKCPKLKTRKRTRHIEVERPIPSEHSSQNCGRCFPEVCARGSETLPLLCGAPCLPSTPI